MNSNFTFQQIISVDAKLLIRFLVMCTLTPFDTCYYFRSNLSLLLVIKNVIFLSFKNEENSFHMSLFLFLPGISLGR